MASEYCTVLSYLFCPGDTTSSRKQFKVRPCACLLLFYYSLCASPISRARTLSFLQARNEVIRILGPAVKKAQDQARDFEEGAAPPAAAAETVAEAAAAVAKRKREEETAAAAAQAPAAEEEEETARQEK